MKKQLLIWDIPTRVCHWLIAVGIVYAWYAVEILEDMEQHFLAGYSVLSLILFRICWGFVGSRYALFKSFLHPLSEIIDYIRKLPLAPRQQSDSNKHYLGHNPIGGLSALAMYTVIALQTTTGLFSNDEYYFGPLSGLISKDLSISLVNIHHINFDIIVALIALHIIAIIFYRVYKKEKLTKAMITGNKVAQSENQKAIASSRLWLAIIIMALSIGLVYSIANSFTDSLPSSEYDYSY